MRLTSLLPRYILLLICLFAVKGSAQIITTYAGNGIPGLSGNGGLAKSAELYVANGIAVDDSGNVYFSDIYNNMVRKVNTSGIITAFAGTGVAGYSGDGGQATAAKLYKPTGVALDRDGNVYIPEFGNNCVRKVTPAGIISTVVGNTVAGYSGDGGPATAAELNQPWHVIVDRIGNIYIADGFVNEVIRKVDTFGIITTFAGNGVAGYAGDGGPATSAELIDPSGLAVDTFGNVYIADVDNQRIRMVNAAGIITTVAGNGTPGYAGDGGLATNAEIASPSDVAFGPDGSMYITDESNDRIRKVSPNGVITTVAGSGIQGYGGDGGNPLSAKFYFPFGIAVTAYGNIFICDQGNARVRKIAAAVNICYGDSVQLYTEIKGGYWVSATPATVSVGTSTGIATGNLTGNTIIYHVVGADTAIVPVVVAECMEGVSTSTSSGSDMIEVSPNPSKGLFFIHIKNVKEHASATVYGLDGKIIFTGIAPSQAQNNMTIDLTGKPAGTYILHVHNGSVYENTKIILE
jgi:sugar lactone lactonase YvrE